MRGPWEPYPVGGSPFRTLRAGSSNHLTHVSVLEK